MSQVRQMTRSLRWRMILLVAGVFAAVSLLVAVLGKQGISHFGAIYGNDFTQYWSAAQLLKQGLNPYDSQILYRLEQAIGFTGQSPILMWNPPYTLVIALPYASLSFDTATLAWIITNVFITISCGAVLWRVLAREGDKRYWLGIIAASLYMPVIQVLRIGQISLWLLLGITGFLVATRYRRDFWAGASLALLAIKPHVVLLFLVGVGWWVIRERRWRVLLGGVITLGAACAIVGLISPNIFHQYIDAASSPPLYWRSTTMGTWLRVLFGINLRWLQFLPSGIGLALILWWSLRIDDWNWSSLLPVFLLASAIFATYGWSFDYVILVPVIIYGMVQTNNITEHMPKILISGLYILTQAGILVLNQLEIDLSYYYWFPVILALLFWGLQHMQKSVRNIVPVQITQQKT